MRLSEHEQRLLADLERALTHDNPSFAQQLASFPDRASRHRRRRLAPRPAPAGTTAGLGRG
jgi:Protein of unknown function (DUF3040)